MRRNHFLTNTVLVAIGLGTSVVLPGVCAETAKDPASKSPKATSSGGVSVSVFGTLTAVDGSYLYEYSVSCGKLNEAAVGMFGLQQVGPHSAVELPSGWMVIEGYQDAPKSLVWVAVGYDTTTDGDLDFLRNPPANAVPPGGSVSGFRFRSMNPGVFTRFVAQPYSVDIYESEDDFPVGPFTHHPSLWSGGNADATLAPSLEPATATVDSSEVRGAPVGRPDPNPMRDAVQLSINLTHRELVRVLIVDAAGRRVATPVNRWLDAGRASASWNGLDDRGARVAGGVYFAQMTVDGVKVGEHRIVFVR